MNAKKEVTLSVIARGLSYILFALLVPMYVEYFDGDLSASGRWFVAVSTCNWLLAIDFGIGNSLRNRLIKIKARNQTKYYGATVVAGVVANLLLAVILWTLSMVLLRLLVHGMELDLETDTAFTILITAVCVQFVSRTVVFVYYSELKTYISSVFNLMSNSILYVYLVTLGVSANNILNLSIVYGVSINAPLIASAGYMLAKSIQLTGATFIRKITTKYIFANASHLAKNGTNFFANQVLYLSLIQVNPFLISYINDASCVVTYTALSTIFFTPIIVVNIIGNSIWGRAARNIERGNVKWAYTALDRVLKISYALVILTAIVAFMFPDVGRYWFKSHANLLSDQFAIYVFFAYSSALIMQSTVSNLACAINKLNTQRRFYISLLLLKALYAAISPLFPSAHWSCILIGDAVVLYLYSIYQTHELKVEFTKVEARIASRRAA